jgi:hypothetical protein
MATKCGSVRPALPCAQAGEPLRLATTVRIPSGQGDRFRFKMRVYSEVDALRNLLDQRDIVGPQPERDHGCIDGGSTPPFVYSFA